MLYLVCSDDCIVQVTPTFSDALDSARQVGQSGSEAVVYQVEGAPVAVFESAQDQSRTGD